MDGFYEWTQETKLEGGEKQVRSGKELSDEQRKTR